MSLRLGSPDRRRRPRGTPECEPQRAQLVSMIVGTYREMPGLCLHLGQASRLFGLRPQTCTVVFDDLVKAGTLRRAHDGQFVSGNINSAVPMRPAPHATYGRGLRRA